MKSTTPKVTATMRLAEKWRTQIISKLKERGIEWQDLPGNDSVGYPGHYIGSMRIHLDGKLYYKGAMDFHTVVYDLRADAQEIHLLVGTIIQAKENADIRRQAVQVQMKKDSAPLSSAEFMTEVERLMDRLENRWRVKIELTAQHTAESGEHAPFE